MAITVTQAAAERITRSLKERGKGIGLRLGIKSSGCSGYMYVIDYADEASSEDEVFEDRGVTVVVDRKSMGFLDGTEVDFGREGLNEAFRFNNPNASAECGCGESFTV